MAILGGLALHAVQGAAETNFDYEVYIKIDGTWEPLEIYSTLAATFTTTANSGQFDLVLDESPSYENTTASNQTLTDVCVGAVQSTGDLTSGLNSNEAGQANNLVMPIAAATGSPRTIVPDEIFQFNQFQLTLES